MGGPIPQPGALFYGVSCHARWGYGSVLADTGRGGIICILINCIEVRASSLLMRWVFAAAWCGVVRLYSGGGVRTLVYQQQVTDHQHSHTATVKMPYDATPGGYSLPHDPN